MAINSLSSASRGLAGLASGMDTQSMVDAMLSGTQAKIDKQNANKTILTYKRDMYRDVITSLRTLQNDFFSFSSTNNLLSSTFFNSMSASTKSTAFKVTATSDAPAGNTTVNSITQLAQSLKLKAKNTAASEVKGTLNTSALKEGATIDVTLDGVRKTINLPTSEEAKKNPQKFAEELQASITHAFGNGITVTNNNGTIQFAATDNSRQFLITGTKESMDVLGMKSGVSNKINGKMRLDEINFKTPLQGENFKFTINGVQFTAKADESLNSIISKINASEANVRVAYSDLEDKFTIESTVSGEGTSITMSQESGNLLTAMFGHTGTSGIEGNQIFTTSTSLEAGNAVSEDELKRFVEAGGKFSLTVNGKEISVTIPKDKTNPNDVVTHINEELKKALGNEDVKLNYDGGTKKVTLQTKAGTEVVAGNGMTALGFASGATNKTAATEDSKLVDLGMKSGGTITIGNQTITIDDSTTIKQLVEKINSALGGDGKTKGAEFKDGKIAIFGVVVPMDLTFSNADDAKKLFGENVSGTIKLGEAQNGTATTMEEVTKGQNAMLQINGVDVERNSNTFTVNGLQYELTATTNEVQSVDVTRNTDQIYEGIVKFMDEYNKLVDKVGELTKADPTYKQYPPLTPEQKKEMSENEIKLWEEKSKQGLLRNDDAISTIMDEMRTAFLARPDGSKISLYDLGIQTTYDYEKGIGGKLTFTGGDNGAKLKEMIAQNPQEVERLFNDPENGIATKLNKAIERGSKSGTGSLVKLAGSTGVPDTASKIYREMRDIDKTLENLQRTYNAQYNRYWKQFNSMEQMISNMNQQSSWLMSQFS